LSQDYAIKLVKNMPRKCQAIINKETTRQFINNKTPRFISCSMCIYIFSIFALSQIVFGFRRARSCQTDCK